MKLEPEKRVGYLVPAPDLRWTRVRDTWKTSLCHRMEPLALMGLIDQNPAFSRMAARMAMSVAHCTHWCESPMGVHPGASWHHRSFQETYYAAACALVLDWAGGCLTPHGRQVIQDAIVMKGLPRMESDFKRMEYIRYMNQGIVFSIGRILGLLALIPSYPRYASQLEEAERDLHEMIDAYILDDGVILEGPGYWAHAFLDICPLFYTLARHRGRSMKDYATGKIRKTGDFALSLLSTLGDGTVGLQRSEMPGLVAITSSTRAVAPIRVSGVDLLTGIQNPDVPPGRTGAFAPRQVRGVYLAASNGIAVLAERPLEAAEPVPGGLRIRSSGLVRAVSESGGLRVTAAGATLPSVSSAEALDWLFAEGKPGILSREAEDGGHGHVILLRGSGELILTRETGP